MKKCIPFILLSIILSTSVFSEDEQVDTDDLHSRVEVMVGKGEKEIDMGTIIAPPGLGAVGRAKMRAKKDLKAKCKEKFNGKIVGKIKYVTTSFSEADMTAHVTATGNCQY